ncbi:hypothetical protein E4U11_004274, partial [Claviceps purpurea]
MKMDDLFAGLVLGFVLLVLMLLAAILLALLLLLGQQSFGNDRKVTRGCDEATH